ncbi:MAG: hypothetical protein IPP69_08005 [Flavobacteriales bacterium]|nr:hypothetical protein [Flavobacteriales bacterium]
MTENLSYFLIFFLHSSIIVILAAVKFVTIILSLFVFVSSAMPCTHHNMEHHDLSKTPSGQHQHDQDNEHGHSPCSPFCVCSCVNAIETSFSEFNFPTRSPEIAALLSVAVDHLHDDFLPTFWQPPKI